MNGGIINSVTRLHLVGCFHWIILRCTDPWILKKKTIKCLRYKELLRYWLWNISQMMWSSVVCFHKYLLLQSLEYRTYSTVNIETGVHFETSANFYQNTRHKSFYECHFIIIFNCALHPLRLIVRSGLDVPTCHHGRAPSGGKWNCGREMSGNFA